MKRGKCLKARTGSTRGLLTSSVLRKILCRNQICSEWFQRMNQIPNYSHLWRIKHKIRFCREITKNLTSTQLEFLKMRKSWKGGLYFSYQRIMRNQAKESNSRNLHDNRCTGSDSSNWSHTRWPVLTSILIILSRRIRRMWTNQSIQTKLNLPSSLSSPMWV